MVVVFFRVGKKMLQTKIPRMKKIAYNARTFPAVKLSNCPTRIWCGKPLLSVSMRAERLIQIPNTALMAIQAGANPATRGLRRMSPIPSESFAGGDGWDCRGTADFLYPVKPDPKNDQAAQINQGVDRKGWTGERNPCNPGSGTERAPQPAAKRETNCNPSYGADLKKTGDARAQLGRIGSGFSNIIQGWLGRCWLWKALPAGA